MSSANATANLSREETAERAPRVTVQSIRVELDLTDAPERARSGCPGITALTFDAAAPETWLDFIGETVSLLVVNGEERDVRYDGARILLDGLVEHNEVRVEAVAAYSRSGEGMHRFHDPV